MTDRTEAIIDGELSLARRQVLSAQSCGDDYDAELYEQHVDALLDERYQLNHPPL